MNSEISNFLKQTISALTPFKADEIGDDCNIFDDLGIDSLSALQILAAVEEKYDIKFEDWDLENYNTLGKIGKKIEVGLGLQQRSQETLAGQ